jgi:hypothetical protein
MFLNPIIRWISQKLLFAILHRQEAGFPQPRIERQDFELSPVSPDQPDDPKASQAPPSVQSTVQKE